MSYTVKDAMSRTRDVMSCIVKDVMSCTIKDAMSCTVKDALSYKDVIS